MVFSLIMTHTAAKAASPDWTEVSTASQLKAALADAITTKIALTADIEVPKYGITINPDKPSLIINGNPDGNEKHFTLTDYKSSASCHTISLMKRGRLKEITVQNLNVIGYNDHGFIYIKDSSTVKDVTMIYNKVNYTGPQMLENRYGHVRIIDCSINIIPVSCCTGEEVAEAINITLEGEVYINKRTPKNCCEVFRVMNDNNKGLGGITVAPGANVVVYSNENGAKVISSGFVHFTGCKNYLRFEENSSFSFRGNNIFAQCNPVNDVQIKKNALVCIMTTGDLYCAKGQITVDGQMEVEENAVLAMIAEKNTEHQGVLMLKGKNTTFTANSPKQVLIYNSSTNQHKEGVAIECEASGTQTLNFNNINYLGFWYKNTSNNYQSLPEPTKLWTNDDFSCFDAQIVVNCEKVKSAVSRNYSGTTAFNVNNVAFKYNNVIYMTRTENPVGSIGNLIINHYIETEYGSNVYEFISAAPYMPDIGDIITASDYTVDIGEDYIYSHASQDELMISEGENEINLYYNLTDPDE